MLPIIPNHVKMIGIEFRFCCGCFFAFFVVVQVSRILDSPRAHFFRAESTVVSVFGGTGFEVLLN